MLSSIFYLIFVPGLGHAPLEDPAMVARIGSSNPQKKIYTYIYIYLYMYKFIPFRDLEEGKKTMRRFQCFVFSNLTNMFKGVFGTTN